MDLLAWATDGWISTPLSRVGEVAFLPPVSSDVPTSAFTSSEAGEALDIPAIQSAEADDLTVPDIQASEAGEALAIPDIQDSESKDLVPPPIQSSEYGDTI
jgi:hypothetical protein